MKLQFSNVFRQIYEDYLESHREVIEHLHDMYENDEQFQQIYRDFEQQKICYIPIGLLVLKPLHRLLHYQLILERKCKQRRNNEVYSLIIFDFPFPDLLDHYTSDHIDRTDCQGTLVMLSRTTEKIKEQLTDSENFILLCELQRDINGFDKLVQMDRLLIRQGCLLKHSKRGLQQRMFFLVSYQKSFDGIFNFKFFFFLLVLRCFTVWLQITSNTSI